MHLPDPRGRDIKNAIPFTPKWHFGERTIAAVSVISSYVLQGFPGFVRGQIGEAALDRAPQASMPN